MHVVVLGAGYAGLTLTRRLESRLPEAVDLTLVNDGPDHVLIHEIHRAIRRPGVVDAVSVSIAEVLDRAELVDARVREVDVDAGKAVLHGDEIVSWDFGAVCLGSETAYYDIGGLREHAIPMKSLADAATVREGFQMLCETGGRAFVGGAGLSGVQVAGELAAFSREEGVRVPDDVEVVLLEQFDEVAPSFPANFQRAVREELEARGVDVRTSTAVERVSAGAVSTDEGELRYDQLIWTGGITGTPATGGDRPTVRADLRASDRTFALGDAARIVDADGEPVPASASAAIREARTAAENIARLVEAERSGSDDGFRPRLDQYRFDAPGWIVSVGDGTVAQVGSTVLRGGAAKAVKASVGAGYLTSIGAVRNAASLAEEELR
ncbi:FAD-dependent oxidoreductase [Halorarum halophilum]|uniref:FAD-dependent oxidoreductase n=1 Tax=Halorarum halophilum TaxID=2743090 RepID=A0A7D5KF03_9EURY|nr:FAD-dependent oxidoreductase [Halobaculum halophilum]QLG27256.1 FAD-dependent oxidoreductase [Halobaculum halophilum]